MKVNIGISAQNSWDWDRVLAGDYGQAPQVPDWQCLDGALAIADLAEPLGFDGIWAPEHFGTPYGMCPNPLQTLAYYAGKTQRVTFGTMVAVAPWWHPVRLAHQIAYLDIASKGRFDRALDAKERSQQGLPSVSTLSRDEFMDATFGPGLSDDDSRVVLNSESFGQLADRLSILTLKLAAHRLASSPALLVQLEVRRRRLETCLRREWAAMLSGTAVRQTFEEAKTYIA